MYYNNTTPPRALAVDAFSAKEHTCTIFVSSGEQNNNLYISIRAAKRIVHFFFLMNIIFTYIINRLVSVFLNCL